MKKSTEKLEINLPAKSIHVSHAKCPNGHSLMDEEIKINNLPSVKLTVKSKDLEGTINLDPVYGSFKNKCDIKIPKGEVVDLFCTKCGISLKDDFETCSVCSAPMFTLHLPHGGIIEGCLRHGCVEHVLKIVEPEELLKRLFDQHMLDSYL